MGVIDDWKKRGGAVGEALQVLRDAMANAREDDSHPLRRVVQALDAGDEESASRKLSEVLLDASGDNESPLRGPAMMFQVLITRLVVEHAAKHIDDDEYLNKLPLPIVKWASMTVQAKETASRGGAKKGKAPRDKTIEAWEQSEYINKPNQASAFAEWYFKKLGGVLDENGKKATPKIPSVRTIAGWVRAYEKDRTVY